MGNICTRDRNSLADESAPIRASQRAVKKVAQGNVMTEDTLQRKKMDDQKHAGEDQEKENHAGEDQE